MRIYKREQYLRKLRPFYTSDVIKVITGIRRCGKSCLLLSVAEELLAAGVLDKDIIDINLDKRDYKTIKTPAQLEAAIDEKVQDSDFKYLFIDEIQNVKGYEEVINAYREEGNYSIFITGSNSYLLSGELITKLTGRYIEFEMFTLNFAEYLEMKAFLGNVQTQSLNAEFDEFLRYGGFPKVLEFSDPEAKIAYAESVVHQIIEKDVKGRQKIRNREVFDKVMTYLINNFGSPTSVSNILDQLNEQLHISVKRETLTRYIQILENAELLNKCLRFDLRSKKSLGSQEKFYLSDLSIYTSQNTDSRISYGPFLENVLYVYLRSKGYSVSVGKIGDLECDFIVRRHNDYAYVQVAMTIADETVEEREYRPFRKIKDGYPRYLFTLDPLLQKRDGVIHLNLIDFMAADRDLF